MKLNKQNKIIVGVLAFLLTLTVGYAVFSQSLNITGTAKAEGNLDIVFLNVGKITTEGANEPTTNITENGRKLEIGDITLEYPTAYVSIPVTIVNNGTIDGLLESITVENLETDDIYVSISGFQKNQIIKPYDENDSSTKVDIVVKIEWKDKDEISTLSTKKINILLNARQVLNSDIKTTSSKEAVNNCTTFTKKDNYEVGDVIAFCNEELGKSEDFYVISDNGTTVTALAKYNLLVGYLYNLDTEETKIIDESTEDYGLQSSKTMFEIDSEAGEFISTIIYGGISFANENENHKDSSDQYLGYWTDSNGNLLEKYGSTYPAFVYDENSNLYEHVQNYASYLKETLGKKSISATLIKEEQLIDLGCEEFSDNTGHLTTCPSSLKFFEIPLFSWTGTAPDFASYGKKVISIFGWEGEILLGGNVKFYNNSIIGIRPVIEINKSEL